MSGAMPSLLAATPLLDLHHPDIEALVARRGWRTLHAYGRIGAVHDFVRDEIGWCIARTSASSRPRRDADRSSAKPRRLGGMTASRHPSFPSALLPYASQLDLQPSQSVFRAGTPPRHVHFVEVGAVRLLRHGRQGEEVVFHDARPGEFLAEASLDSARYHCDAVTSQPTVILRVAKDDFQRLLVADADFARLWMALLAAQLRTARARIERLSLRSAEERIRHLLLSEGRGSPCELAITGSLKDLARRLGLTHESLYRTLARMQKDGVIDREGLLLRLANDGGSKRMT